MWWFASVLGPHVSFFWMLFTAYSIVRTVPSANGQTGGKKKACFACALARGQLGYLFSSSKTWTFALESRRNLNFLGWCFGSALKRHCRQRHSKEKAIDPLQVLTFLWIFFDAYPKSALRRDEDRFRCVIPAPIALYCCCIELSYRCTTHKSRM